MQVLGLVLAIIFTAAGIGGIISGLRKNGRIYIQLHQEFVPVLFLITGCLGIVFYFLNSSIGWKVCGLFVPGVLTLCIPLSELKLIKLCNTVVTATCIDYIKHPGRGRYTFDRLAPVFEYTYSGTTYRVQTPVEYILEKRLMNRYKIGEIYQIWIDRKNPGNCVERKKVPLYRYIWVLVGMMMIGLFLIILFIELPF